MSPTKKQLRESTTLEGMPDIMNTRYYEMQGLFEKAQEIAMYYGFEPINSPIIEPSDLLTEAIGRETDLIKRELYNLHAINGTDTRFSLRPELTTAMMRAYMDHQMHKRPQPVMLYSSGPVFRHEAGTPNEGQYHQHHQFNLEILGTEKPVADAIIIQVCRTILSEAGGKDLVVHINSIGDADSRVAYERELRNYYKKHLDTLAAVDREKLKHSPLRVLDSKENKTIAVNADAPDPVCSLTSNAKKQFKKVLEHLEELDIPYQLDKGLVRGFEYYTDTVFEIKPAAANAKGAEFSNPPLSVCGGGRYNYLAKKIGNQKDIPGVGAAIGLERVLDSAWWNHLTPRIMKEPKCYFIQLGFDAKLKSLEIVEQLRQAKIPVLQSLSKDSLTTQLAAAEKTGVPYTIIFGQREAIDGTVIVRTMEKRSQKTVKITDLVSYLRKLK